MGEGGGYFDLSRVLWDERKDGPMPDITLGGMVRTGAVLEFDQPRMDAHLAVDLQEAKDARINTIDAETGRDIRALIGDPTRQRNLSARINRLLLKRVDGTATQAEVAELVSLDDLFARVELLFTDGNARESVVQTMKTVAEVAEG